MVFLCSQYVTINLPRTSHEVPKQFPYKLPWMFPIAPHLYPICFVQSCILFTYIGRLKKRHSIFVPTLALGYEKWCGSRVSHDLWIFSQVWECAKEMGCKHSEKGIVFWNWNPIVSWIFGTSSKRTHLFEIKPFWDC